MTEPLSCVSRPTRATISWRVCGPAATGLPVSRVSSSAGKQSSASTLGHPSTALSARSNTRSDANSPSAAGADTDVRPFLLRWSRARRGSCASRATADHSPRAFPSRLSASHLDRHVQCEPVRPKSFKPASDSESSLSSGAEALTASTCSHSRAQPLRMSVSSAANADGSGAGWKRARVCERLSMRKAGSSRPKAATSLQSGMRAPVRSSSVARGVAPETEPGSPAVATRAFGRYTRSRDAASSLSLAIA
mmetsp:Transcript_22754/g.74076  ORF Transcript_22754/g.74076 Transcript_22754/m.74076 type:complete len:250 (+) Transcript_22754:726-1475(+)